MLKVATDMRYVKFLRKLHRRVTFDWYMEIGCRTGRSFAGVRGKTIAVDPFFRVSTDIIGTKPAMLVFQQTSDDFFDSGILSAMKAKISFSFLDGMHLFEYLYRDFRNAEKNADKNGVIALHDCVPSTVGMTTRDLNNLPGGGWTGDVWKMIPVLRKYRPDLRIDVLGCAPTGLVLVSNLSPRSRVLTTTEDEIMGEWKDLTLQEYGTSRFADDFEFTPADQIIESDYSLFDAVRLPDDQLSEPEFVSP